MTQTITLCRCIPLRHTYAQAVYVDIFFLSLAWLSFTTHYLRPICLCLSSSVTRCLRRFHLSQPTSVSYSLSQFTQSISVCTVCLSLHSLSQSAQSVSLHSLSQSAQSESVTVCLSLSQSVSVYTVYLSLSQSVSVYTVYLSLHSLS